MEQPPLRPAPYRCLIAALSAAACLLATPAAAQTLGSVLSIEFGKIAVNSAGSVTIPATSTTRTKTGGVMLVAGSTIQRGRIIVTGTANTTINVSWPTSITVTGSNGGSGTLVITRNGATPLTLSGAGSRTIRFGGTLTFTGPVPTGTFSTTVPVTVVY
jgi:Domain of unknown function (DUF4402)